MQISYTTSERLMVRITHNRFHCPSSQSHSENKMAAQAANRIISVVATVCKCRKKRFRSNRVDLSNNCNNPRTQEVSCCDCVKKCNVCLVLCVQNCVDKQT